MALRFQGDRLCPPERLKRLTDTFDPIEAVTLPGDGHSTLTFDYEAARRDPPDPAKADATGSARDKVLAFLKAHL